MLVWKIWQIWDLQVKSQPIICYPTNDQNQWPIIWWQWCIFVTTVPRGEDLSNMRYAGWKPTTNPLSNQDLRWPVKWWKWCRFVTTVPMICHPTNDQNQRPIKWWKWCRFVTTVPMICHPTNDQKPMTNKMMKKMQINDHCSTGRGALRGRARLSAMVCCPAA